MEHWFYRKSVKKIKWNKQKIFRERARPSSSKLIFDWTEWYNWLFWRMKVGPKKRFEWIYGLCPTQIWLFLIIIFACLCAFCWSYESCIIVFGFCLQLNFYIHITLPNSGTLLVVLVCLKVKEVLWILICPVIILHKQYLFLWNWFLVKLHFIWHTLSWSTNVI